MNIEPIPALLRRVRLVMLLDAAESAGLVPIKILRLHTFAYLSNVLAPVWDMPVLEGKVLKRRGGPFYPVLQKDLDRLIGMGVATISGVGHIQDEDRRWRLEGAYSLHRPFAQPILNTLALFREESQLHAFILELGYALSCLSNKELDIAVSQDATYSDSLVSVDNIIEFDGYRKNYSANAAQQFDRFVPGGNATLGEKLHLYVRHIHRRIHGGR